MILDHLQQQLNFIYEIDKLKTVFRKSNLISDPDRFENTAEHSWHLAMYVLILSEHANEEINLLHTLKLVLFHDLVEIDAGDTFGYDESGHEDKFERESKAAARLFGLLPEDQAQEYHQLWLEYESAQTNEAKFALAVDRLQPVLHNYLTGGKSWKKHGVTLSQVEKRMIPVKSASLAFSNLIDSVLKEAKAMGLLK